MITAMRGVGAARKSDLHCTKLRLDGSKGGGDSRYKAFHFDLTLAFLSTPTQYTHKGQGWLFLMDFGTWYMIHLID